MMSKPTIPNGTLIDNRYLIQKVLGQGGLGRTYLAGDTRRFNEACVLKEFAPSGSGKHSLQKSKSLFKREAEILYHVQHPQIPDFLACFEDQGRLFLVQEYVNGKTYSDMLKARRKQKSVFAESEVIHLLNNLLPVLNYIHQCGIIHRDISPDNIMLPVSSDLPVLIDFGVGKQIVELSQLTDVSDEDEISYVGKMSLVGKVGYAPHEQIRLGVCSPSSDLYALGVTAVVLLTCKDPSTLMNQHSLQWEWRECAVVSPAFGSIIDKMLAETPANRYQSAAEVSADLVHFTGVDPALPAVPAVPVAKAELIPPIENGIPPTVISLRSGHDTLDSHDARNDYNARNARNAHDAHNARNGHDARNDYNGHDSRDMAEIPVSQRRPIPPPPTYLLPQTFIQQCERKLAEYIGPMATMIIDEVIDTHQPSTPAQLVDLLLLEIPSPEESQAFRQHLLG